ATDMAVGGVPGAVTKVEFFEGETLLGEDTTSPYSFSWTPSTTGVRVLTAKATDNETASSVSSPVNVTVLVGDGRPTITSFAPTGGVAGDSVVISGNNLGIASSVQFGALAAAFTANNASQITATVPASAVTAPITVSNSYGSVTSTNNFSILPIIFREDFASVTTGDSTSSGGSSTAWAGNTNFASNNLVKVYQAGGAVKLGTSSAIGSMISRSINLAGNSGAFTLSFKVKGWSTKEGDIKVTAGVQSQTVTYSTNATMTGEFETKSLNFTGGTSATTIKIETTAKRAFIDDVTVTSEAPSSPPVITSPSTAGGIAGTAFSYTITASNSPSSFGATGLPAWASINTTSGVISGATPVAGTNVVSISASNTVG
ncbi:MAG: Ig-like domain-containing protein, partial [Chthoniobacterales bacterium]